MRNVIAIGVFVALWIGTLVVCNLGALALGLQHPSLPAWWRQLVSWVMTIAALAVAAIGTTVFTRRRRALGPPPPPPPSFPPR